MRRRHQSDKPKSLLLFHLMKASSVPFFDWEGFHATHELSVDEASLFFDADDCGFVSWRHGAFDIESRVKTRFWGSAHQQALKINTRPGS